MTNPNIIRQMAQAGLLCLMDTLSMTRFWRSH